MTKQLHEMRKVYLILLAILGFYNLVVAQYNPDNEDQPKQKRFYKFKDISLHYSGAIFDFNSSYLDHMHEISEFTSPNWIDADSTSRHNNRSEINTRINFQKQLVDENSSLYGNFSFGLCVAAGYRLDAAYRQDHNSFTDTAIFNSEVVTNLDSTIVLQKEYRHKSTDLGIDFTYTISSSPKPTLTGEIGIGFSSLLSFADAMIVSNSESTSIRYTDQYSRNRDFNELNRNIENLDAKQQLIMKLYIPLILSYKLNRSGTFSLSTMFSGGVEFQKPEGGSFYSYPYFTIGIGTRFRF